MNSTGRLICRRASGRYEGRLPTWRSPANRCIPCRRSGFQVARSPEACRARATFQFVLEGGTGKSPSPCLFQVTGKVREGRIEDPRLPGPLTEVSTEFSVSNEGLTIQNLVGHSGPMTLKVTSFTSWGHGAAARKSIEGDVEQLELDHNLLAALPDRFTETWSKYLPLGQINARFTADYDGTKWHPRTATVECLDVSFSYHKFSLPVVSRSGDGFAGRPPGGAEPERRPVCRSAWRRSAGRIALRSTAPYGSRSTGPTATWRSMRPSSS